MQKDFYQYIEDYTIGKLEGKTLVDFEKAMQDDPDLAAAVQSRRIEWEMQELLAEKVLRQQIRARFSDTEPPKDKHKGKKTWWIALAALLFMGIAAFFFLKNKDVKAPLEANPRTQPTPPVLEKIPKTEPAPNQGIQAEEAKPNVPQSPPKQDKPQRANQKNVPIAKENPRPELLQMALAQYEVPQTLSGVRGLKENRPLDMARNAFSEKNYTETINLLQKLPENETQEALSLRAHANFLVGLYDAAARDFSALKKGGIYKKEAEWYESLAQVAMGIQAPTALQSNLKRIADETNHPYRDKAGLLLEKMGGLKK